MASEERGTLDSARSRARVFKTEIESHQGRVIDMAGDSILASFETASGGDGRPRIQERLNASAAGLPRTSDALSLGVHPGDVIEKADGTIYGDGVNVAARLQALAEPGGLTISGVTQEGGMPPAARELRGPAGPDVKNIPYTVRAFSRSAVHAGIAQAAPARRPAPAPAKACAGPVIGRRVLAPGSPLCCGPPGTGTGTARRQR
jgi:adenylate cyclase